MARTSTAHTRWEGDLPTGSGKTSLSSGAADTLAMTWKARAEGDERATSPEELIAAAHSACFSMALSNILAKGGNPPASLDTTASVLFEQTDSGFGISSVALRVEGSVPGMSADEFTEAAETAKDNCPVSKALAGNVSISVESVLV